MNLRRAVARPASLDDLSAAVAVYESTNMSLCHKTALRIADAFLTDPAGLSEGRRAETLECFAPSDVVELALKLVAYSANKTLVALGLDAPVADAQFAWLRYDDGVAIVVKDDNTDAAGTSPSPPRPSR